MWPGSCELPTRLGVLWRGAGEGGALPASMSTVSPREPHGYRKLQPLATSQTPKNPETQDSLVDLVDLVDDRGRLVEHVDVKPIPAASPRPCATVRADTAVRVSYNNSCDTTQGKRGADGNKKKIQPTLQRSPSRWRKSPTVSSPSSPHLPGIAAGIRLEGWAGEIGDQG